MHDSLWIGLDTITGRAAHLNSLLGLVVTPTVALTFPNRVGTDQFIGVVTPLHKHMCLVGIEILTVGWIGNQEGTDVGHFAGNTGQSRFELLREVALRIGHIKMAI